MKNMEWLGYFRTGPTADLAYSMDVVVLTSGFVLLFLANLLFGYKSIKVVKRSFLAFLILTLLVVAIPTDFYRIFLP